MTSTRFRIWTVFTGFVVLAVFLGCCVKLNAQEGMAALSGVVSDSSGAGVPGAQVALESTLERAGRQTVTDSTGAYVIPALLPGSYQLTVKASGFETQTLTGIVLTSGQGATLNVTLGVAKAITEVNVKAALPLLETTTSTVGGEVTSKEFTELPTLGRNFTTLIGILPGVVKLPAPDETNLSFAGLALNPSVYGQRQRDNEFVLDGLPNYENLESGIPMYPPPEAIGEMKVSSGMDSGAYGFASGANINVVTKSGTNRYHGDAWEFLQNNALNARSYFVPSVGAYKWNQFGGTFGGPLVIPRLVAKERAWYIFGYYEGIRDHSASNSFSLVPTAAELEGNFSEGADAATPIYNPYTSTVAPDGSLASRQQFPGNQIPSNLLNPAALTIATLAYPLPNLPPGLIPGVNYLNTTPNINTGNQWSVRADHQFSEKDSFFARISDESNPTKSVYLPAFTTLGVARFTNLAVNDTHVFNPTFLVTARFGMQRSNPDWFTEGPNIAAAAGTLAAFPPYEGKYDSLPPIYLPGYPGLSDSPYFMGPEFFWTWAGGAQKIKGRHTISFGGGVKRDTFFTDCQTGTFEEFTTDQTGFGAGTGNALASFLLGLPESAGRAAGTTAGDMSGNEYSLYVQDTFRATPNLTLNLGLRWDYASPMHNSHGSGTFQWETGQYYWDLTNPITGAPANIRRGLVPPDYRGYQPRLGIAYQITPKTVVRAGYGIFFDTFGVNYGQTDQGNRGNWPFAFDQTVGSLNLTVPTAFLQDPFPGPPVATSTPLGVTQALNLWPATSRTGYVGEWSFTLQRQITPSLKAEAAYFGSHGVKLSGQIYDNTALFPGTDAYQDRQRWPNFPAYIMNGYNEFSSWYDGLSLNLEKRISNNSAFLINYTWSKTMDDIDSLASVDNLASVSVYANPERFDLGSYKGPAGFDVRHVFNASYFYEIPLKSQNKWANAAIAHWSLSGIFSLDSGIPYVAYLESDNENLGVPGSSGSYGEFPSLISNPNAISHRTANEWFNTAAYVTPPFGTYGNAGKHTLYSDPEVNWDSAIYKRWPFGESRDVEFRGEFFNLLNLSTFLPPGVVLGTSQFGTISGTRQGGRTIQFALKMHF